MGVLTEDLTRLRNEIMAMRKARQRGTEDRRADVSRMLSNFSKGLGALVRKAKADRLGSISDLKRTVTNLLREVRTDLSGARQAWVALDTTPRRAAQALEGQGRPEAAASVEGRRSEAGGKRPLVLVGGQKPVRKKRKH